MRRFVLNKDTFNEGEGSIYKKRYINIKHGLTILVGCNGIGKTTFLHEIYSKLINNEIPVLLHSCLTDSIKEMRSKALLGGNMGFLASSITNSEGENIVMCMGEVARKMGELSRKNQNAKELWFLIDAVDSGLSVDNIVELKELLFKFVIENNPDKEIYILVSANEYELARDENCFDVYHGRYITFRDYEQYRQFILESRKNKDERNNE